MAIYLILLLLAIKYYENRYIMNCMLLPKYYLSTLLYFLTCEALWACWQAEKY